MGTRLVLTLTAGFLLVGIQGGWHSAFSQSNPPAAAGPTIVAQEKTTAAIVEDVDPQARHVLLHLPDDTLVTLKVGPHLNLAEFKPGDHVTARYVEAKLLGVIWLTCGVLYLTYLTRGFRRPPPEMEAVED